MSRGVGGLGGSEGFDFFFGCLEFVGGMVISLEGWRKAVSRMAAPGGPVLGHRRNPSEGVVPRPSCGALGRESHVCVLISTL